MPFRHADQAVVAVAAVVGEHERRDARQVGLERQHEDVGHQADVVLVVLRDAQRPGDLGVADVHLRLGAFDPLLDLAHAFQVFVELALVVSAEFAFQRVGVLGDEIEDALVVTIAPQAVLVGVALVRAAEEALEDQPWVDLLGHRRRFGAPRQVVGIGAAVAGVARAGAPDLFATDLQRREARGLADLGGGDLIDRDADLDVCAAGLLGLTAGEEGGHGAGVVAGAVAVGERPLLRQPAEDREGVLELLERFEGRRQREVGPLRRGRPGRHVHAVGDVDEAHAQRRLGRPGGGGRTGQRERRQHLLQERQRHARPQATQHRSP